MMEPSFGKIPVKPFSAPEMKCPCLTRADEELSACVQPPEVVVQVAVNGVRLLEHGMVDHPLSDQPGAPSTSW